jgi:hypothetical protein
MNADQRRLERKRHCLSRLTPKWPKWAPPFIVAFTMDGYPDARGSCLMWIVMPRYKQRLGQWMHKEAKQDKKGCAQAVCLFVPEKFAPDWGFRPWSECIMVKPLDPPGGK